jgi:hypothetical protein
MFETPGGRLEICLNDVMYVSSSVGISSEREFESVEMDAMKKHFRLHLRNPKRKSAVGTRCSRRRHLSQLNPVDPVVNSELAVTLSIKPS